DKLFSQVDDHHRGHQVVLAVAHQQAHGDGIVVDLLLHKLGLEVVGRIDGLAASAILAAASSNWPWRASSMASMAMERASPLLTTRFITMASDRFSSIGVFSFLFFAVFFCGPRGGFPAPAAEASIIRKKPLVTVFAAENNRSIRK